jgi:pyruvate/2-oxoglutarate dehydrogenase complex dihydrolipoamide dehydrogenase (E3) component
MSYHYRVIVIGSGSGGKDAALLAARAGKRTLLIESDRIGGTGVHRGCHAVRALRACATHYDRIVESDRLGVFTDLVTTNWPSWLEVQHRTSSRLAEELSRELDRAQVEVKFGKGELLDAKSVIITDDVEKKETVTGEYIILATGSRPAFPGNEKARVLNRANQSGPEGVTIRGALPRLRSRLGGNRDPLRASKRGALQGFHPANTNAWLTSANPRAVAQPFMAEAQLKKGQLYESSH